MKLLLLEAAFHPYHGFGHNLNKKAPNAVVSLLTSLLTLLAKTYYMEKSVQDMVKSHRSQMFFKMGVLKSFSIFTGKHLC